MHPGLNFATSQLMRPAIERRAEGIQAQAMSRQFVGAGNQLDISGRGLSTEGAMQLAGAARDIAKESKGQITQQDVLQLTQMSGEQGLLDFAQNSDQIAKSVKGIMGLVSTMSKITGDPDFKNNVQRIGQMKRMGFEMGQVDTASQNLAQYARMAGVDVDQLMQRQGMQGAATFRGQGLLASQGMMTGAMAGGQSRMFEASGAMGSQEVAMLGGQEGISQRINEMNAGFMSKMAPQMMGAMVKRGPNGELTIDRDAVSRIQSGKMSFQDALGQTGNVDQATLTEMVSRMPELQAQMGDVMGPQGIQMAMMQQAKQHSQLTGLNLRQSAQSIFGQEAGQVLGAMQDPKFQAAQLQQQQAEQNQRVFEQQQAREAAAQARPGFLSKAYTAGVQGLGMTTQQFGRYTSPLAQFQEGTSNWLARNEELSRRRRAGITTFERDAPIKKYGYGDILSEEEEAREAAMLGRGLDEGILAQERRGGRVQGALKAPGETFFESEAASAARQVSGQGGFFGRVGSALNTGRAAGVNLLEVDAELAQLAGFEGVSQGFRGASRALGGGTEQMLAEEQARIKATSATVGMQIQSTRMTDQDRQAGMKSVQEKLGGLGATVKLQQKARAMIEEHVGFGIGEEGYLSEEQLEELGPEFKAMSDEEKSAFLASIKGEKAEEFRGELSVAGGRLYKEATQKEFEGSGGEARLQARLRKGGLGKNVAGKAGGIGGAIIGGVSGFIGGSMAGPGGAIMGAVAGAKAGSTVGGGIMGAIGEELGLDADLTEAEKEVAGHMTDEAGPFVILAGLAGQPDADKLLNALITKYTEAGNSDADIQKLIARGEEIYQNRLSPEAQEVIKTKGISLAGPEVAKALTEGDSKKAADEFDYGVKSLGAAVAKQGRDSARKDMGAFLQSKGIKGGGVSQRELLKRIQESSGTERQKFEKAFSKETVAKVVGADLGERGNVEELSGLLGDQMGGTKGGEMTMAQGLMEGLTGGANIVGQMGLTKDMMAEFGEGQAISNRHQAEMKGYLKIIATHFSGKDATDLVLENLEE
jgi:hypothetical protein